MPSTATKTPAAVSPDVSPAIDVKQVRTFDDIPDAGDFVQEIPVIDDKPDLGTGRAYGKGSGDEIPGGSTFETTDSSLQGNEGMSKVGLLDPDDSAQGSGTDETTLELNDAWKKSQKDNMTDSDADSAATPADDSAPTPTPTPNTGGGAGQESEEESGENTGFRKSMGDESGTVQGKASGVEPGKAGGIKIKTPLSWSRNSNADAQGQNPEQEPKPKGLGTRFWDWLRGKKMSEQVGQPADDEGQVQQDVELVTRDDARGKIDTTIAPEIQTTGEDAPSDTEDDSPTLAGDAGLPGDPMDAVGQPAEEGGGDILQRDPSIIRDNTGDPDGGTDPAM